MDQEQKAYTIKELLLAECRLMVKYPHLMDEYIERNYETEKTNHEAMMKKAQEAADGGSSEGL